MARGKAVKKDSLSVEERLEQALVPDWEQPYKVPENWVWTKLNSLIELISGRDAALSVCNDKGIGIPYILGASNLNDAGFSVERWIEVPQVISQKNDILLSVKGTIGKLHLQTEHEINISRQIMAIRPLPHMNLSMMFLYLTHICQGLKEAGNGLIPGISRSDILNKEIPLPPFTEQQRIVDRIESLFAKLDEAKEKAQAALDSFENRKAAILHQAFTGELTTKWREENGVGLDSWNETIFSKIFDVRDGTHESPVYQATGYPLITSKNLKNGKINYDKVRFISKIDFDAINLRSKVDIDDILIAMIGTIGNPVVVIEEPNYAIKNVALLKSIKKVNSLFVRYYLETHQVRFKMQNEAKGSTQKFVSLGYLRAFPISIPTLPEQNEIVRILDSIFEKEQQAKELASVIEKIDLMKKAILARAFRGELGTNDPKEESSIGLLKEILEGVRYEDKLP